MANRDLKHVYELYIRTTPETLWRAITSAEWTRQYFYGTSVESDWSEGSPIVYRNSDGTIALEGRIIEAIPDRRLVTTFSMTHHPEGKHEPPSQVTWDIESRGPTCKLTVTHDGFASETVTYRETRSGWNPVLSGLKTLLETGEPLEIGDAG